ncbi:aspartic proteinase CDR1-like [Cicer arietinum]|uniref:Aspartic proteinase CDR1-like n=1 Tax=Cicer arietinum TaxID=3827 RepID=A0A1S2XKW1_CICAR|nr:aspartic proteinase CDR1-like [Cicer arietinum]
MSYFSLQTLIFFYFVHFIAISHALSNGFSVELIHRNSPRSPLYHPTETNLQRVLNDVRRSINRVNHLNKKISHTSKPISTSTPDTGEYLMSYSVGTPPFKVYGIIDTGSDFVWIQCKPCNICYNQTSPIFNPSKSSSYKNISCSSRTCKSVEQTTCSNDTNICEYTLQYGDGSKTTGDVSLETLTLDSTTGSSVSFPKTVIGCGHTNTVSFRGQSSGVVGLGSGRKSLIKQLDSSIDGKFSYCLIPFYGEFSQSNSSSKLNFGDAAIVSGEGVVSTPLVKINGILNDLYFVTLEAFSVGNKRIGFGGSKFGKTNATTKTITIDSGTPVTFLPHRFYVQLRAAVAENIKLKRVDFPTLPLNLCYNTTLGQLNVPKITAHFSGGDVKLDSNSIFIPIGNGVMCFAFLPSQGFSLFGNILQHNLLIGFDVNKNVISFKPTDCTKH